MADYRRIRAREIEVVLPDATHNVVHDPWADLAAPRRRAEDGWPTPQRQARLHYFEQLDRALRWKQEKVFPGRWQEWVFSDRERKPQVEFDDGGFWLGGRTWTLQRYEVTPLPPSDSLLARSVKPGVFLERWLDAWDALPAFHPVGEEGGGTTCVLILPRRPNVANPHSFLCEYHLALQALGDAVHVAKAWQWATYRIGAVKFVGWQTSGLVPTRTRGDWDHLQR